jgi:hypothetical protein
VVVSRVRCYPNTDIKRLRKTSFRIDIRPVKEKDKVELQSFVTSGIR